MFEQMDQRSFIHRTDADGKICYVNAAWLAFAAENGWGAGTSQALGSELMASITDLQTRHIYGLLMNRVRESGRPVRFSFRCDSPDCRRLMEMQMRYDRVLQEFEFCSRALHIERRETMPLLDASRATPSIETLSVCSWCKAVLAEHAWIEVEQALIRLRLFAADALPQISHGICPACSVRLRHVAVSV
ncbi:MAG: hypothetical protein WBG92_08910 [Thiohalocapsa sp.]